MQLQIRTKDGENVVIDAKFSAVTLGQPENGTELVAATITHAELSQFSHDEFFSMVGEIVDYFTAAQASQRPAADWHKDEWLPQTIAHERKRS